MRGRPLCKPKLTAAQQVLAADPRNLDRARRMASIAAERSGADPDELESAALMGLVDAAGSFDPGRGLSFATLMVIRVRGAIADAQRNMLPRSYRRPGRNDEAPEVYSFNRVAFTDEDGHRVDYVDTIALDEHPVGWEIESLDAVEGLSRKLPPRFGEAVRLYYGHAVAATAEKVGDAMRTSESNVCRMLIESHEILRDAAGVA